MPVCTASWETTEQLYGSEQLISSLNPSPQVRRNTLLVNRPESLLALLVFHLWSSWRQYPWEDKINRNERWEMHAMSYSEWYNRKMQKCFSFPTQTKKGRPKINTTCANQVLTSADSAFGFRQIRLPSTVRRLSLQQSPRYCIWLMSSILFPSRSKTSRWSNQVSWLRSEMLL